MKIYDITQELFTSNVYPGDMPPSFERKLQIANGDGCNLTNINICAHNGTHIDAPYHFCTDGKTVDKLDLDRVIGECTVVEYNGEISAADISKIMRTANMRILFKGAAIITLESAKELNRHNILLVGCESQSVGDVNTSREVHLELLGNEVVLLEGIVLKGISEGDYILNAAPLNLGGADGAPCRAILIENI